MRFTRPPHEQFIIPAALLAALLAAALCSATGCTTPPSVEPLLALADRALRQEAAHLADDMERDRARLEQTRRALADAFDRDLEQADPLTGDWVREALRVYVIAREQLVRHEADLERNMATRADNLRAGSEALHRALGVLRYRDAAVTDSTHTLERQIAPHLERINPFPTLPSEPQP